MRIPGNRLLSLALRPFTKIEPHEAVTAAVMTLTAFLLLSAYYLLKTVREPLILLQGGAEVKLYARAAQAVIMLGFVQVYGEIAKRVGRMKLLAIVFVFFTSNLVVFTILARAGVAIGLAFFLWVGVFSYTVVAQFWALAADIYTEEQGKRIFPILGGGASVGAVAGARLAKTLVPYGPHALMGAGVIILLACVALIVVAERRARVVHPPVREEAHPEEPLADVGPFRLLARDRYLLLIGAMVILLNWVNSAGEYLLDRMLLAATRGDHEGTDAAFVGAFKADYFAWYNGIGVALQLFAVSRIIGRIGVRYALLFLPGFALAGYGMFALFPVLANIRLVKIGENSLQYSLQDTTRHALFLVATRAEKYVGKTLVDTVCVRIGAIMSALVVFFGTRFGMPAAAFATLNVVLAVLWLVVVLAIGRENALRTPDGARGSSDAPAPREPCARPATRAR